MSKTTEERLADLENVVESFRHGHFATDAHREWLKPRDEARAVAKAAAEAADKAAADKAAAEKAAAEAAKSAADQRDRDAILATQKLAEARALIAAADGAKPAA